MRREPKHLPLLSDGPDEVHMTMLAKMELTGKREAKL